MEEWVKIRCPKCGKMGSYQPTISGKDKCRNHRCRRLVNVGYIEGYPKIKYHKK